MTVYNVNLKSLLKTLNSLPKGTKRIHITYEGPFDRVVVNPVDESLPEINIEDDPSYLPTKLDENTSLEDLL